MPPRLFRFDKNEYGELKVSSVDLTWKPALYILDARWREGIAEVKINGEWYRIPQLVLGASRYVWFGWQNDGTWLIRGKDPDSGAETSTAFIIRTLETCPQCNEEYVPGDTWRCPHCGYKDIPY